MPPRRVISVDQKRSLRAQKRRDPSLSNITLCEWFKSTYQQPIALSSVSEILSSRYAFLDDTSVSQRAPTQRSDPKRLQREHWPELKDNLFQWMQRAEQHIMICAITLREKAEFFWRNLEKYRDKEMPSFSNSWLHGFQQRRGIADHMKHGELASARSAIYEMNAIQ